LAQVVAEAKTLPMRWACMASVRRDMWRFSGASTMLLDVGHLGRGELARAGSRAGGAVVQTAGQGGVAAIPCVVSAGFEVDDAQDHGEREGMVLHW
jgi:hypothetical protein